MKWITNDIATAPYNEIDLSRLNSETVIVDVRDLVDKESNELDYINFKIEEALKLLKMGKKIIVCCDYGMSRSNSLAIGIMVKWLNMTFFEAVGIAKNVIDESGVKIEMLNSVYSAISINETAAQDLDHNEKNICVTGSSGFLGRNLVNKLSKTHNLFCPTSKEINLTENIIEFDLLVKKNQIDTIIHLANPKIFTNTKAIGDTLVMLKNVLDVSRTNDVKIIFLSGWEIYSGYRSESLLADENLKPKPKGTYGETKWLCELLIKQYVDSYNIKHQIIRSGPVYGTDGEKPKFIYNFIGKALRGEEIRTHKYLNGDPKLDLLFIDDLVDFLDKAISSNYLGEINIGSGTSISTSDVANYICEIVGSKSALGKVNINDYSANIIMDNRRANEIFKWNPRVNAKLGLAKILESYKNE